MPHFNAYIYAGQRKTERCYTYYGHRKENRHIYKREGYSDNKRIYAGGEGEGKDNGHPGGIEGTFTILGGFQ